MFWALGLLLSQEFVDHVPQPNHAESMDEHVPILITDFLGIISICVIPALAISFLLSSKKSKLNETIRYRGLLYFTIFLCFLTGSTVKIKSGSSLAAISMYTRIDAFHLGSSLAFLILAYSLFKTRKHRIPEYGLFILAVFILATNITSLADRV